MGPLALQAVRKAQYLILELSVPGRSPVNVGVLLLDPAADRVYVKLRADWDQVADPEDAEVLAHLEEDLERQSRELGGEAFLRMLEDTLSNALRIGGRQTIIVGDSGRALTRLYERHVEGRTARPGAVVRFQTHLPLYSLRAAAGGFGADMEVEAEDWVRVPEGVRPAGDMFAARVSGRSMEPLIPDGSLCLFRHSVTGSRQGKLLLIQHLGASDTGGEFTIKRYTSRKTASGGSWRHEQIRLEPLNPEFEAWDLDPSELEDGPYRVCGEFLRVVPYEEQ